MVGVVSQFPMVGASFMGAYRDARQNRLAEAAARAEMAAREADRRRQEEARQAFGRLINPPAPVGFDTGLNMPGAEIPVAAEAGGMSFDTGLRARGPQGAPVAAAVPRYSPEQQQRDLGAVFMGGMGGDLAAYREFTSPAARQEPSEYAQTLFRRAATLIENGTPPEEAYGVVSSALGIPVSDVAVNVAALGPGQQRITALQQRALDAGLQPDTPEYRQFMLNGGPERGPSSVDRLATSVAHLAAAQGGSGQPGQVVAGVPFATPEQLREARLPADAVAQIRYDSRGVPYYDILEEGLTPDERRAMSTAEVTARNQARVVARNVDRAIDQTNWQSSGIAALLQDFPGLPPAQLQARIDTIMANLGFDALSEMRETSPTGAAVGNVTERELDLLAALRENFSTSQNPEQLINALQTFRLDWQELQAERRALLNEFYPEEYRRIYGNQPAPPLAIPEQLVGLNRPEGDEVTVNGIDYRFRDGTWRPFYETF